MRSVVVFLGAGASKPFGYLLTAEILPRIVRLASEGRLFSSGGDRAEPLELLQRLKMLLPGVAVDGESPAGLPLITDVLSLLDRLAVDGSGLGPRFSLADALHTRRLLERAIAEVLDGPANPPGCSDPLAKRRRWADALVRRMVNGDRVTVITTNYDLLFEGALYERMAEGAPVPSLTYLARSVDYGFSWRMPFYGDHEPVAMRPNAASMAIFKLHGSLNWLRCNVCGYIYVNPRGAIYRQAFTSARNVHNTCVCGGHPLQSVLVTPSTVREIRDANLLSIWSSALESLRTSDEWIFVGYSLPGEDVSIRAMLLRAYHGWRGGSAAPEVRAYLFKPASVTEPTQEEERYRSLFPNIDIRWGGVEAHIDALAH